MAVGDLIRESSKRVDEQKREWVAFNHVQIWIKDPLPPTINLPLVIVQLEKRIPRFLTGELDNIFIGQFPEFKARDVNAVYDGGAIYVTNEQDSNEDLLDDIIHELAHSVEDQLAAYIYQDGLLANEFLGKRKRLLDLLNAMGYNVSDELFLTTEYYPELDQFLYEDVGYDKLALLTAGLFLSPYAITSLREYWADGFEDFFLKGERASIMELCPILFNKLDLVDTIANES